MNVKMLMCSLYNLLLMNILCALYSLPIITLFPSFYALVDVMRQTTLTTYVSFELLHQRFHLAFQKQATKSYKSLVIILPIALILWLDLRILLLVNSPSATLMTYVVLVSIIIFFILINYLIIHQIVNEKNIKSSWVFSLIYFVKQPISTFLLLLLYAVYLIVFLFQTGLFILFCFSWPAFIICFSSQQIKLGVVSNEKNEL